MTSDAGLIADALGGDLAAFEELVVRHHRPVLGLARWLAPDPDSAEDLAQETFLEAHRSMKSYRGESTVGAWLRGILRNRARMLWRRRASEGSREFDGLAEYIEAMVQRELPDDPVVCEERRRALRHCLGGLAEKGRRLVELRYRQGMSCQSIGEMLHAKPPTVRTALVRLHRTLRECIERRLESERT